MGGLYPMVSGTSTIFNLKRYCWDYTWSLPLFAKVYFEAKMPSLKQYSFSSNQTKKSSGSVAIGKQPMTAVVGNGSGEAIDDDLFIEVFVFFFGFGFQGETWIFCQVVIITWIVLIQNFIHCFTIRQQKDSLCKQMVYRWRGRCSVYITIWPLTFSVVIPHHDCWGKNRLMPCYANVTKVTGDDQWRVSDNGVSG